MPRPPAQPVRLRGLLKENASLAALLPEAERLRELNRLLARAVGPALARSCGVAAVQGGTVVVYCGNNTAAARLRTQATTIVRALSRPNQALAELKVKVRADWAQPLRPEKSGIGRKGVQAWEALESSLHDPELKAAVGRLLKHQRG